MADNKTLKTRLKLKTDTATNWAKATSFIPLKGEMVVYTDSNNKAIGIKIGDGSTVVTSLPFVTDTSILPPNSGEIKTKYRIAQKGYTNGATWYYKLCTFNANNSGNYASAILSGRIGGWVSDNMSYLNALVWNRGTPGISLIDIAGSATAMSSIWNICDLVLYTNSTTSATADATATLYVKCKNYFTFDLDLELFQSTSSIVYDGTYITTTPTGTLAAQASTTSKRLELVNGKLLAAGTELSKSVHKHTVSHTPEGTVSAPIFTGSSATTSAPNNTGATTTVAAQEHTHSVSVSGTAAAQTFTGAAATSGGPSGTAATVASSAHTHSVTAAGTVASASAGTAVTGVSSSISNKCLTVTFTTAALSHSHTFTGKAATSGAPSATTSVANSTHTHSVTAKGTNAASTVSASGTASVTATTAATVASSTHTHTVTAKGTNSAPTFTGTKADLTTSAAA